MTQEKFQIGDKVLLDFHGDIFPTVITMIDRYGMMCVKCTSKYYGLTFGVYCDSPKLTKINKDEL
jgi:hypothetical protein